MHGNKSMSTADPLKSKREEVYSTLLGRIPAEFKDVKRAMQRRYKGNGKLSSVGLPENIAFTIEAIQGASTQAELEKVQVLVKNDAFKRLPKADLKSQLLRAAGGGGSGGMSTGTGAGAVSGAGGAETVLKSKYDEDMRTEKEKYDLLLDACKKKLKERSTELEKCKRKNEALEGEKRALSSGPSGMDKEIDLLGKITTLESEYDNLDKIRKDLEKETTKYKAEIKTLRAELIAKSSAADLQKQLEDQKKEIVRLENNKKSAIKTREEAQAQWQVMYDKSEAAEGALRKAEASLSDNDTKAKAALKECKDSVTALQKALEACKTTSTRKADESRSTQDQLQENIRQLQGLAESRKQEAEEARQDKEERGRGRVTVMNTLPDGFSSLKDLGILENDLYTMREFFLYARSKSRRQHILYEHMDGKFREDLKETTGSKNSIEFRVDNEVFGYDEREYKQGNDDIFVSNEFATYLFKPVYTLEKDKNREEVKLPETFKTLDRIRFSDDSDYIYAYFAGVTTANTKIGHSDLFQFVEARASNVLVFVQRTDDKKWVPLKSIRKEISSKIPFTIGYNGKKGNTKVSKLANLSRIAVLEKEYLEWYNVKNPTVIDNGKRLGGRGEIATEDNTMIGTRISNEGTKKIFEITGFKNKTWSTTNKNARLLYTGNYVIVSHPNTGDFDSSSDDSSSDSGGEESSEDEIEDGGEDFQEIVRQRRQRNRPTGELSVSDDDGDSPSPIDFDDVKIGDYITNKKQFWKIGRKNENGDRWQGANVTKEDKDGYKSSLKKEDFEKGLYFLSSKEELEAHRRGTATIRTRTRRNSRRDSGAGSGPQTRSQTKPKMPKGPLEQTLRVVSYEGVAGEIPALPLLRIPEPHEL